MSPQTRRQAAKAQNPSSDSEPEVRSNGNGSANGVADASDDAPRENIFLFIPNIIGMIRKNHYPNQVKAC